MLLSILPDAASSLDASLGECAADVVAAMGSPCVYARLARRCPIRASKWLPSDAQSVRRHVTGEAT
eukprot:5407594-Prymnesium_polylepis.1